MNRPSLIQTHFLSAQDVAAIVTQPGVETTLRYLREAARELGLGQRVSLIPELDNPKDLFSLIRPTATTGQAKLALVA